MRCRRQGWVFSSLGNTLFVRGCFALLLVVGAVQALADSTVVYDPFDVPQGAYQATHVDDVDNVSIIEFSGNYDKLLPSGEVNAAARAVVAQEFYRTHADDYDFLVVFTDFEFETGDATAFYNPVRNDTQGIGLPQFDLSSIYGSDGKLQGYVDMAAFSRYEWDSLKPSYERGLLVLAHEFFHRWGVFVQFIDEQGELNNSLLGHQDAHWSFKVHTSASVQYGHDWHDHGDGSFKAHSANRFFSSMDLYLMGLYEPDEVEPFYYIESADRAREELSQPGVSISGIAREVTVEDIIAAEGPRVPAADVAQKEFKFAFVYLKSASAEVDSSTLLALKRFRENFVTRLSILTGGRAVANVYPQAKPLGEVGESAVLESGELRSGSTSVPEALAWLRSAQSSEGYWEDQPATRLRDTALLLDTLTTYDPSFQRINEAESWLRGRTELDNDSLARRLGVRRSEQERQGDLDTLLDRRNDDGGWGVRAGYESDVMDTALVLRSIAPNLGGAVKTAAVDYLLAQQANDGGWPTVEKSTSQVTVTALAMDALRAAGVGGEPILRAVEYLQAKQLPDGSFGVGGGTVHETAHVILSLLHAGYLEQVNVGQAAAYLSGQQSISGDWNGSVYSTALAVSALQSANFANWLISDVQADPKSPRDGERVKFTVIIENDGRESTEATVLRVYKGDSADSASVISEDIVVPSIPPRNAVAVDFYWDSMDSPGERAFTFAVDPDDLVVERSELDNFTSLVIDVREAAEGIDLELNDGAVSVAPASPYYLPSDLSVSISVRNAGTEQADGALVRLFRIEDGAEPVAVGDKIVTIPPRQTSVVNFVDQLEVPGTTRYQAVADPADVIAEADETNNTGTASVTPRATIDFIVDESSVSMQPLTAVVNEDVEFTVVVRNQGTLPAPPSTVRYTLVSEGQEQILRTNNIVLDAAEAVVQTLSWRVDTPGPKQLIVEMDPDQTVTETDETNNRHVFQFDAEVLEGTNVGVRFSDITVSPNPMLEGYGATLSAEIRNNGTVPVNGVVVRFFNGNPADGGSEIGTTTIGTIAAAERAVASVVWSKVPDSAEKLIYVQVDPDNNIDEFDETDNLAFQKFGVQALPDFVLGEGSLTVNPAFPKQGQSAEIQVDINNAGTQAGEEVVVKLYEGNPLAGGRLIDSRIVRNIEGRGSASASFEYLFGDTVESVLLVATVNEDRAIQEKDYSNNQAERSITIQNNDFHVSERYISPDGDGVKDVSRFSFRLDSARDVVIVVANSNGREVRRYSGDELQAVESGSVEWDGRNNFGGIVTDDKYTLSVIDISGATLGGAVVYVDTNRSSLLKAANTPYERITDLPSLIRGDNLLRTSGNFEYSNNDEFAFFMGWPYDSADPKGYVTGIYRSTVYGGQLTALVDFASVPELASTQYLDKGPLVSPMSDTIAFITGSDVWSVNVEGGQLRHLLSEEDLSVDYGGGTFSASWNEAFYSHDGAWLYYFKRFGYRLELGRVKVDGTGVAERLAILEDYSYVLDIWRSPSSDQFFAMLDRRSGGADLVHFGEDTFELSLIEEFGYNQPSSTALAWAPDGRMFAVGDSRMAALGLFDPSGTVIERKMFFAGDPRFQVSDVRWNPNNLELAYEISRETYSVPTAMMSEVPSGEPLGPELCDFSDYEPVSGIYIWNTVTGSIKRPIAVTEMAACDGGGVEYRLARASEMPVDVIELPGMGVNDTAYYTDEKNQFWLYEGPQDWEWSPGERRIIAKVKNNWRVFRPSQLVVVDVESTGEFQEIFTDWPFGNVNNIKISSTGRRMFLDDVAYESLLNLSLDLRALRSRAAGGVQLSGTAADLNFDHYELDYSHSGENREWKSVSPDSLIPVVDQEMTVWVPPGPGSYYVRLTGVDRAGNVRRSIKRTSWGDQAALTDLYRDPGYISPNGDGIQDVVNVHMRILQPVNLTLQVFSEEGQLVRTIRRSFDLIGAQEQITWDGRDDYGSVVADGRYSLELGKYKYSVVVDSTPPAITLAPVNDMLRQTCDSSSPFCKPYVAVDLSADYFFEEENYYRFRIERERDGSNWQVVEEGEFNDKDKEGSLQLRINDLNNLDLAYRIVVEDLAGNQSVKNFDLSLKRDRVILNRALPHRDDYFGSVNPIQKFPNVPFANYDAFSSEPSTVKFSLSRFRIVESVQAPIESVSLLYREQGQDHTQWKELLIRDFGAFVCPGLGAYCAEDKVFIKWERTENQFTFLVDLGQLNEASTYELKVKVVDQNGEALTTNGLILTQISNFRIDKIIGWGDQSYRIETEVEEAPFEIVDDFIRVSSAGDPRFINKTSLKISEKKVRTLDPTNPLEVTRGFFIDDVIPCTEYVFEYVLVDEFGNEAVSELFPATLGCTEVYYRVSPAPVEECGVEPTRELQLSAGIYKPENSPGTPGVYQVLVWEMFEDGADAPKTLFTKNNPELGKSYAFTLDTSPLEEGVRDVRIRAVKDSGEEISERIRLPIDHTPPEVAILAPEPEGKVCAIAFETPNGQRLNGALINADILDVHGSAFEYQMTYQTDAGEASSPGGFFLAPSADMDLNVPVMTNDPELLKQLEKRGSSDKALRFAESGHPAFSVPARRTLSGNLKALGDVGLIALNDTRDVSFEVAVTDFGGYKQCVTQSFYLDASVEGYKANSRTNIISPNGDGNFDQAVIDLSLDEDASVSLSIHEAVFDSRSGRYTPVQEPLFAVYQDLQYGAGESALEWDGTDGSTVINDGHYFMVLEVRDACGNTENEAFLVEVDSTPPVAIIGYPQTGNPVSLSTEIIASVSDVNLTSYRLEYQIAGDETWAFIADGRNNVLESLIATWNTFGLQGEVSLRLVAKDRAGNQTVTVQNLNIDERTDLLSYVDLSSLYISPNGDSVLDNVRLNVGTLEPVRIDLNLKSTSGALISTLASGDESDAGEYSFSWNGQSEGNVMPDGTYQLEVVARSREFPGLQQTESVTVIVDTLAPELVIRGIENGFAQASITATISDLHLDSYIYYKADDPDAPDWTEMAMGDEPEVNRLLEPLSKDTSGEGEYGLRLVARDLAGNRSEVVLPYIVDFTPPHVAIDAPVANAVTGDLLGTLQVIGVVEDLYFAEYSVWFLSQDGAQELELLKASSLPATETLAEVSVEGVAEGPGLLVVEARDSSGQVTRKEVPIVVDNTAPEVQLSQPAEGGYVTGPQPVSGSVQDDSLESYVVEIASGHDAANDSAWTNLVQGTREVVSGNLAYLSDLPEDGNYSVRLSAVDAVGHETDKLVNIIVDTTPPEVPTLVSLEAEKEQGVHVTWEPVGDADLAGYIVQRGGRRQNADLIEDTVFLDPLAAEGTYEYRIVAVDLAGNQSEPSESKVIRVDWTPPTVALSNPISNSVISGLINVRGTAFSEDDFAEYELAVGVGSDPQTWQTIARSPLSLQSSELAQWDTLEMADGDEYILRLTATDLSGNVNATSVLLEIDNTAPAAPTGLMATAVGNDVELSWDANSETDFAGYYLFSGGRLANADLAVIGDMSPYLLGDTGYLDEQKPDGTYQYYVYAADAAGNVSESSEPAEVTIETQPPHVEFERPVNSEQFENTLTILADALDNDVSVVNFVYRATGAPEWVALQSVNGNGPYSLSVDATLFPYGDYELSAVATDVHGNIDPGPEVVAISKVDLTRPDKVVDLLATVDGAQVKLSWTENSDIDLAGYFVKRTDESGNASLLNGQPLSETTFTDENVDDGQYQYVVYAVDMAGNESEASEIANGWVYTPYLTPIYTPTTASSVMVSGNAPSTVSGTAELSVQNLLGTQTGESIRLSEEGAFAWSEVAVQPGENVLEVRVADDVGNRSKAASLTLIRGEAPAAPRNLLASAQDSEVNLIWDANAEPDILGYLPYRQDGALVDETLASIVSAEGDATSSYYAAYKAIDGDTYSYFRPRAVGTDYGTLTLVLSEPSLVSRVEIENGYGASYQPKDFNIEVWTGSSWLPVLSVADGQRVGDVGDGDEPSIGELNLRLERPYLTDRLRMVFTDQCDWSCRIGEFRAYLQPVLESTSFTASNQGNGFESYTVTAINRLGMESNPSDPAETAVGDVLPPEPVNLRGEIVNEHDADLRWEPSSSADATNYRVYRNGELVGIRGATATSYVDGSLKNGVYIYHVVVEDAAGNLSPASNKVSLTVAASVESRPENLVVTSIPEGEALNVAWEHANPDPIVFRVNRADSVSGVFSVVAETTSRGILEEGLTNGQDYFYRITVVDEYGNESLPSDTVKGVPQDVVAPEPPLLLSPVKAGQVREVDDQAVSVIGFTEPGARVAAFFDGNMSIPTIANSQAVQVSFPFSAVAGSVVSPDGTRMIVANYSGYSVVDLQDQASWTDNVELRSMAWINNEMAVAIGYQSGIGYRLLMIDAVRATGTFVDLPGYDNYHVQWMETSPARNKWVLLVTSYDSANPSGIWVVDPDSFNVDRILPLENWGYVEGSMALRPDGSELIWQDSNRRQIGRFNLDSGERTWLAEEAAYNSNSIAWSPEGNAFVFLERSGGAAIFDLGTGTKAPLSLDTISSTRSVYWAQEERIVIGASHDVYEYDLSSSSIEKLYTAVFYNDRPEKIFWSEEQGVLSIGTRSSAYIVEPAGRFETFESELRDGANQLFAIAQDDSGNESEPTEIATVIYRLADNPDLAVELAINPNVPIAGSSVELEVRISNLGELAAPDSIASVSVIGPDGDVTSLWNRRAIPPLAAGASITYSIQWQVPGLAGMYNVITTVDDDQVIKEVSRANNSAIRSVNVVSDGGVKVRVSSDRDTYGSRQDLMGSVEIVNPSQALEAKLSVWIEDDSGYEVDRLLSQASYPLLASSVNHEAVAWNTGAIFAGGYSLVAQISGSDASVLSESRFAFAIEPEVNPVLAVRSNQVSYGPNENVAVTTFVANEEANSSLRDLELVVRIINELDQTLFEERVGISELNPSDVQSKSMVWNTANIAPGELSIQSELLDIAGETLASATNQVSIKAGAPVLPATLNVVSGAPVGRIITPEFSVSNAGNSTVSDLELVVSIVGLDDGRLISSERFDAELERAETFEGQATFQTGDLPLGQYRVLLTAGYQHEGVFQSEVLATRAVRLFDADAPNVTILSPASGSVINAYSAKVAVSVEDNLSGVKSVEAQVDGGPWIELPPAMVNYYVDLMALSEGAHSVAVRASDLAGNVSVPVSVDFTIDNQVPGILIQGVEPGGYYPTGVSPVVLFDDASVTRVELNGEMFVSGSVVDLEGAYRLFAYAEDAAGNSARDSVEFVIDKTRPEIAITGVSDAELYAEPVIIDIAVTDANLDSAEILLNEMPYRSGDEISKSGEYSLVVIATDKAGNSTRETRIFEIDTVAPEKPEVTNLSDGDIVSENKVAVLGSAEPQSVIDLSVGDAVHTTIADDTGAFGFAELPLEDGNHGLTLTATDRAGNVSEKTQLTITVRGKTQLDLRGKITARSHVLVWIPEHPGKGNKGRGWHAKGNEFDNLIELIGSAYDQNGTDYQVVRNESDFVTALRSQRFNVLLIGSLKPALGHPLKMSYSTELEIRGVVGAGTGLVWINNHTNLFELWHDVIGARSFGALPHVQNIHLDDGPATSAGAWEYEGRHGVRVIMTGGIGVGQLEVECKPHWHLWKYYADCDGRWWQHDDEHKNPALVINKYGAGSVAMFTFNPGEMAEPEHARSMVSEVTNYATPLAGRLFDEGIVDIEWTISGTEHGQDLAILQTLSDQLEIVSVQGGEMIDPNTAHWSRTALSSDVAITSQVRLSEENAEGAVSLAVYDGTVGAGTLLAEATLAVAGQQSRSEMEFSYMESIESIDYSVLEYWPVHKALIYAQSALSRDLGTRSQLEWAIGDLKKSIAWLSHVERQKVGHAIVSGGQLLQYYQSLWYQAEH